MLILKSSSPYKLNIERLDNILDSGPIMPRCYKVTYLKSSNNIIISIDKNEDKSKNIYKGEGLCGRWCYENQKYMLFFQVNIATKNKDYEKAKEKNKVIREEIPLMLNAIIKAEENFLKRNKELNEAEIFIKFNCPCDDFYKVESFGKLENYIDIKLPNENSHKDRKSNSKNKKDITSNLILNLIRPHIEIHLWPMYGREVKYLIREVEILSIEEFDEINKTFKEHEIVVSVKVLNMKHIEEVILSIRVKPNGVIIEMIA